LPLTLTLSHQWGEEKKLTPFCNEGKGDLNLFLLRHCEERLMRRGNLIYTIF